MFRVIKEMVHIDMVKCSSLSVCRLFHILDETMVCCEFTKYSDT